MFDYVISNRNNASVPSPIFSSFSYFCIANIDTSVNSRHENYMSMDFVFVENFLIFLRGED